MNIFNDLTVVLLLDDMQNCLELGMMCILFGFILYSLLSLFSYGIMQVMRLFNITA